MTTLLDANVLIAMSHPAHVHYSRARSWFNLATDPFASCPITQGSLLRHAMRMGFDARSAMNGLERITSHPRHDFWPDLIRFEDVRLRGVMGHGQVTDAYLAQLAREHGGSLATFDEGLAALHSDVAELIP